MGYRNLLASLLTMALVISGSSANGSGLGTITGPASGVGSHDTGLRELVSLKPVGNFLIGRPAVSTIELIVIDAPDHRGKAANLILRELVTQNGLRSVLLASSDALENHLRRVTIYTRGTNTDMVLLEQRGETWQHHTPQTMKYTSDIEGLGDLKLLAYPLQRLGLYWMPNPSSPVENRNIRPPLEPTASALLGGDISRGLLPWFLSGLLLIVIMSLSHWVHAIENRSNR